MANCSNSTPTPNETILLAELKKRHTMESESIKNTETKSLKVLGMQWSVLRLKVYWSRHKVDDS